MDRIYVVADGIEVAALPANDLKALNDLLQLNADGASISIHIESNGTRRELSRDEIVTRLREAATVIDPTVSADAVSS